VTDFHDHWSRGLAVPLRVCWCKESFVRIHQNSVRPLRCAFSCPSARTSHFSDILKTRGQELLLKTARITAESSNLVYQSVMHSTQVSF
jgi:hypothetical protein